MARRRPPHRAGLTFGALGPLLAVRAAGERRTLAIHYEVMSARASARAVQRQRFRTGIVRDVKSSRGFAATAADQRSTVGARDQEYAVAAGAALVRSPWPPRSRCRRAGRGDHAAWLENDAAGRARLLRLELARTLRSWPLSLPVGIGLPRQRGALP